MRKFMFWSILLSALIVTPIGCNEEQLRQVDRIVDDINNVAAGGRAVVDSPVGLAIPGQARILIELALGLASAGVITYQKWRAGTVTKTLTAVVKGIEKAGDQAKENPTNPVKASIEASMKDARVFDQANKAVDRIKLGI